MEDFFESHLLNLNQLLIWEDYSNRGLFLGKNCSYGNLFLWKEWCSVADGIDV